MPQKIQFIRKNDLWIIAAILIAAMGIWAYSRIRFQKDRQSLIYAEIFYDGALAKTILLDEPRLFTIDRLPQVEFEVKDSSIAFIKSDCPDQVCVHEGWLKYPGQYAACLPNKVALRINSEENGAQVDVIAR